MKNKPKSVTIMGERITIEYTKEHPAKNVLGLFDPENFKITVHDSIYYDRYLLHECVHACLYLSGLTNLLEEKMEEAICSAIETGLFGIYSSSIESSQRPLK